VLYQAEPRPFRINEIERLTPNLSTRLEKADMGFSEFTRERQFLSNVSPSTLEWYKHSFKWLLTESPSQEDLNAAIAPLAA
jgi:hypothetical protein